MSGKDTDGLETKNDRRTFLTRAMAGAAALPALELLGPSAANAATPNDHITCMELPPDDAATFTTTCQYCMVQCGYKVRVWEQGKGRKPAGSYTDALSGEWYSPSMVVPTEKAGKAIYIAVLPDKDCVVNKGEYSVRGGTNALTLFGKNLPEANKRLLYPMIRKSGKGSPLVQVSWDEAIDFAATNLIRLKEAHGPDSLSMVGGDWLYILPTYAMAKFWFTGIGSSTVTGNGWFFDEESAGISAAFGTGDRSFTEEDFELTKLLVTVGTNLEANGSVWYQRFYYNNMAGGNAKHIEIDPRRTYQAQLAEENGGLHLQLRPGSDAILLGAMIREVLNRDAYDKEFVNQHVVGFDKLKAVVGAERFSLSAAARETWVPEEKIRRAVDMLIAARGHTMLLNEKGIMHQMAAFEAQHALAVLGAIMGNVGKPGACTSRAGGHPSGTLVAPSAPPTRKSNDYLYKRLEADGVQATWAFGCNIAKQMPSLTKYWPMMQKTFLIVQDRIHTDMDEHADVLLPAATWGESDLLQSSVTRRLRINQQFMDPPGEAKPDWWIVAQVAKKMGYKGYDWKAPQDLWDELKATSDGIKDISWEMLERAGTNGTRYPYINGKAPERLFSDEYAALTGKRFPSKDGKVHVERIEVLNDFNVGKYEWKEVSNKYPLMAIDFRLNELWNTGYTYWDKPAVSARTPDAFVMIHTDDAQPRGIKTGDTVELSSPYGKCRGMARVTTDIVKGVVGMPALFPKRGQEFNLVTRPNVSPVNGDFDTMVAVSIAKV